MKLEIFSDARAAAIAAAMRIAAEARSAIEARGMFTMALSGDRTPWLMLSELAGESMTLTFTAINRARRILWVVTGREKSEMLRRLAASDPEIPAGRICAQRAELIADREAARELAAEMRQEA